MSTNLISYAGWYFLPNLVTGLVQTAFYSIWVRAGETKPQPGTARFVRDRKRIHVLVIVLYLLYTIYEADWQLQRTGDFYQDLGVSHDVDEKALQSRFRRLTVQYHPDKVSGPERPAVEAFYVRLKLARDTLTDPAKRFAYDRFGPDMLQWQHCKTIRDFVTTGTQSIAAYYVASGCFLILLGVIGYLQSGFWRYLVMAALFAVELHTMTRPAYPTVLSGVVNPVLTTIHIRPPYLPYQMLTLARKLTVTFFIALSQLGPLLKGPQTEDGDAVSGQQLDRLDMLAKTADQEVTRLMGLELAPFGSDGQSGMRDLRSSLKEWLVQNTIRNDAEVRTAVTAVLERRRQGAEGNGVP